MEVFITQEFQNRYGNLPVLIKKKAEKQEQLFKQNPFHPSLNTEKLSPKQKEIWSFRVDKKYRIFFRFYPNGKKVLLLTIGPHDWIYKWRF